MRLRHEFIGPVCKYCGQSPTDLPRGPDGLLLQPCPEAQEESEVKRPKLDPDDVYAIAVLTTDMTAAKNSSAVTPSNKGDQAVTILEDLKTRGTLSEYIVKAGVAVLTAQEGAEAAQIAVDHNEAYLVNYLTPYFESMAAEADPRLVVINGERYRWLESSSGKDSRKLKPDVQILHRYLAAFRVPYANALNPETRQFGAPAVWRSRNSINVVTDAKIKLDADGLGDLVIYIILMAQHYKDCSDKPLRLKGIVYDGVEFWLVTALGTIIQSLEKVKWTATGSRKTFVDFLRGEDAWTAGLYALCQHLNVEPASFSSPMRTANNHTDKSSALLGCGAHGRAVLVRGAGQPAEGQPLRVLKVVVVRDADDQEQVRREFEAMVAAHSVVPNLVVAPAADSFHKGIVQFVTKFGENQTAHYAGYLMDMGGRHATQLDLDKFLDALQSLHAAEFVHGDARLANAVIMNNTLKFIDFRLFNRTLAGSSADYRQDVVTLLKSLKMDLTAERRDLLDEYAQTKDLATLRDIFL